MLHGALIGVHAAAGAAALVAGAVALPHGRLFPLYWWSLLVMQVALVLALAAGWPATPPPARGAFAALAVLGAVMCLRARAAGRDRPTPTTGPSPGYLSHVGFTLVGLTDAFLVVTVLNAGAPVLVVVATGVGVAVAGHLVLTRVEHRLAAAPEARPAPVTAGAGAEEGPVLS